MAQCKDLNSLGAAEEVDVASAYDVARTDADDLAVCADACGDVAVDVDDDVDDGAEADGDSTISSITSNISNICNNMSIYISMQSKIIRSVPATSSAEATSTVAAAEEAIRRSD